MDDQGQRQTTPLGRPDATELAAFWKRFMVASDVDSDVTPDDTFAFGDSVELADELLALVLDGPKRATAGAVADYEADGVPLPEVGSLSIVTDGTMRPRAVIETTEIRLGPLSSVDDEFAWDEGEGDRSRTMWLDDHTAFFGRRYAQLGLDFHPDIPVVFERFALRYQED